MTTDFEAKTNTQSTNQLLKVVIILLLVIVISIVSIFAISAYWASYQQQQAKQQAQNIINGLFPTSGPPTPTPSTWAIVISPFTYAWSPSYERMSLGSNSPNNIIFSANDILYNGHSANSYGSFAPYIRNFNLYTNSNDQYMIRHGYDNTMDVYFPEGTGSPWSSGMTIQMSITTSTAKGSTTFTLQ